jgi:prophage antirepressor-like protein
MQDKNQVQVFNFHGAQLEVVMRGSDLFVSVRRVCDALGIAPNMQIEKLKTKSWTNDMMIISLDEAGRAFSQFMLHIESLPMWLATISEKKVSEAARPKLLAFQKEAARVLADHFLGQRSRVPIQPKNLTHLQFAGHTLRLYSVGEPLLWISAQDFMLALGHPKGVIAQGLMPPEGESRPIRIGERVVDLAVDPSRIARHIVDETCPAAEVMRESLGVVGLKRGGKVMLRRVAGLISRSDFDHLTLALPEQSPPQSALPHLRLATDNPTLH